MENLGEKRGIPADSHKISADDAPGEEIELTEGDLMTWSESGVATDKYLKREKESFPPLGNVPPNLPVEPESEKNEKQDAEDEMSEGVYYRNLDYILEDMGIEGDDEISKLLERKEGGLPQGYETAAQIKERNRKRFHDLCLSSIGEMLEREAKHKTVFFNLDDFHYLRADIENVLSAKGVPLVILRSPVGEGKGGIGNLKKGDIFNPLQEKLSHVMAETGKKDFVVKFINIVLFPDLYKAIKDQKEEILGLDHENLMKIYDMGEIEIKGSRNLYMIMENCANAEELHYDLDPEDLTSTILQISKALEYLNKEKRLLHRDVKPGNILVLPENKGIKAKLIDFDLLDKKAMIENRMDKGIVAGTWYYMPPEGLMDSDTLKSMAREAVFTPDAISSDPLSGEITTKRPNVPSIKERARKMKEISLRSKDNYFRHVIAIRSLFYRDLAEEVETRVGSSGSFSSNDLEKLDLAISPDKYDCYSLGMVIRGYVKKQMNDPDYGDNAEAFLARLESLGRRMTNALPGKRAGIGEVIEELENILSEYKGTKASRKDKKKPLRQDEIPTAEFNNK